MLHDDTPKGDRERSESPPYFKFRIFLGRPSEYHRVT